ncbi:hypothetical protein FP435_01290 [Lactobacillus sp. PV037]|uniref:hypothetical protein n=1 Tax=unclassified Lactobacillus TaxID=2620435 RepID=UPI00223EC24B|nr:MULTISPECIES: hypothetical protein [unclassified Lactobacillus]QNQ82715.1 hypothetical protein FP433_06520 [Lactobacillus sp. PV012]QNQ83166.1 hypothetical protein FP435_01290 [Lactobacillus sp. PV037]
MKLIGEGGIYNGMAKAESNEVGIKNECWIHITQQERQRVKMELIKNGGVIKRLVIQGNKWIRLKGNGWYKVRVKNNKERNLKVGISIFEKI